MNREMRVMWGEGGGGRHAEMQLGVNLRVFSKGLIAREHA